MNTDDIIKGFGDDTIEEHLKFLEQIGVTRSSLTFEQYYYAIDSLKWMDAHNVYRPRFLGALLVAGGLIYAGYKIGEGAGELADAIRDVAEKLEEIKDEIKRIADGIEAILEEIKRLPEVIRGIVDGALLRESLIDASTLNDQIARYMSNERVFLANIDRVADRVDEMERKVNLIVDKIGRNTLSGFLTCAPHVSVWAQAFTLVQRALGTGLTAKDTSFHRANKEAFFDFFRAAEEEKARIESHFSQGVFDSIPKDLNQRFRVRLKSFADGDFQPTDVIVSSEEEFREPELIPGIQERLWVCQAVGGGSVEYLGYASFRIDDPNSVYRGKMIWAICFPGAGIVNPPRTEPLRSQIKAMSDTFSILHGQLPNIRATLQSLDGLPEVRAKVEEAMEGS